MLICVLKGEPLVLGLTTPYESCQGKKPEGKVFASLEHSPAWRWELSLQQGLG